MLAEVFGGLGLKKLIDALVAGRLQGGEFVSAHDATLSLGPWSLQELEVP